MSDRRSPQPELDREAFARALRDALARHGLGDDFAALRAGLERLHGGGPPLVPPREGGAWEPAEAVPQPPVLERHQARVEEPEGLPARWEEAQDLVLPRIRPTLVHALQPLLDELGEPALGLPHAQMTEHLCVEVVLPGADGPIAVAEALLDRWEVGFPDALAQAGANLAARSAGTFLRLEEGTFTSTWEDDLHASRLLFPDLVRALPVAGDAVALPLTERRLLIAGTEERDALVALADLAASHLEAGEGALALRPLRLEEARWQTWLPPEDHPAWATLHALALQADRRDYAEQGRLLDRLLARREGEVRAAPLVLEAEAGDEGRLRSACTWTRGRVLALPRAEVVHLEEDDGRRVGTWPWEALAEACGDLMHPFAPYPERVLVHEFPEPWQRPG